MEECPSIDSSVKWGPAARHFANVPWLIRALYNYQAYGAHFPLETAHSVGGSTLVDEMGLGKVRIKHILQRLDGQGDAELTDIILDHDRHNCFRYRCKDLQNPKSPSPLYTRLMHVAQRHQCFWRASPMRQVNPRASIAAKSTPKPTDPGGGTSLRSRQLDQRIRSSADQEEG